MKIQALFFLFSLSSVVAWRVDRRCLEEGQLLTGDDVEAMLEREEGGYEKFDLNDNSFEWDQFPLLDDLDIIEEPPTSLRGGGSNMLSQNVTSRSLQSGKEFNLKLTWQQGACWQDEWIERDWCMECRKSCNSGDVLELQKCSKNWKQRFEWDDGQIKVASKNMCLTKSGGLRLRSCGGSNQKFNGYRSSGGFQIKPSSSSECLSQHHHPKSGEIIELTKCSDAARDRTDKFNVYWPSGGSSGGGGDGDSSGGSNNNGDSSGGGSSSSSKLTKMSPTCTSSNKCGKCQGDCDSDNDCQGNLECKQRSGKTALDTITGCSGTGVKGLDYCA